MMKVTSYQEYLEQQRNRQMAQPVVFEQAVEFIEWHLARPFSNVPDPISSQYLNQIGDWNRGAVIVRFPDATTFEKDALGQLIQHYTAAGWGDVTVMHGTTRETEYQVFVVLSDNLPAHY